MATAEESGEMNEKEREMEENMNEVSAVIANLVGYTDHYFVFL